MKHILITTFLLAGTALHAAGPDWPPATFASIDPLRAALGRDLFYDPILSGNKTVSCATCHHPDFGTSDGVSLSIGDGGIGLGPARRIDPDNVPEQRIPRNAPALFNLGAAQFTEMFLDGRLEVDPSQPDGIRTPLGREMVSGFNGVLAAQAMFPVLAADEMAGHYSENPIAQSVRLGQLTTKGGAWDQIAGRVNAIPEYRADLAAVLGHSEPASFTDIANLIADFTRFEWRADQSPFDLYLAGEAPLNDSAEAGRKLFYGKAGCSACHSGRFQTDQQFHAIAMPQIGPGKAARFQSHARDKGRMRVTGAPNDAYRFHTPSLRNVALSAPYGHDGAYGSLRAVVVHHLDPVKALMTYDRSQAILLPFPGAKDFRILDDADEMAAIAAANELAPVDLSDGEVDALLAFLNALTDPISRKGRLGVPDHVPSGLALN